jgi:phosphoglycerate dehydrogenase-like enzyme
MGNVPLNWAEESTKLQWLQLHSAGLDPYQQLSHSRFPITHLKGFFGQSVAETAVAGIMAVYRGIDRLSVLQTQNHWVGGSIRPSLHLLFRKKWGF